MKISQSLKIQITAKTFIDVYECGNYHSCTFMENEDSLSINFDSDSLNQLSQLIQKLKDIQRIIQRKRQDEITRELEIINQSRLPRLPVFSSNGKDHPEIEIEF